MESPIVVPIDLREITQTFFSDTDEAAKAFKLLGYVTPFECSVFADLMKTAKHEGDEGAGVVANVSNMDAQKVVRTGHYSERFGQPLVGLVVHSVPEGELESFALFVDEGEGFRLIDFQDERIQ